MPASERNTGRSTRLERRIRVAAIVLLSVVGLPAAAQKTDVVTLENGDEITGELKELERGLLRYKTDFMGTIYVEWDHVLAVSSRDRFQLETRDGLQYYGSLAPGFAPGTLSVTGPAGTVELDMEEVVRFSPIKDTFIKRLDGSLTFGLSFTKASDVFQFNLGASANYRTLKSRQTAALNSIITSQEEIETTRKQDVSYSFTRFLDGKKFVVGTTRLDQNTELGLNLRTTVGGGYGYHVVQTNRTLLDLAAGLGVNRESSTDGMVTDSVEAVGSIAYQIFRFDTPKTDMNLRFDVLPSLTESGRVRSNFDAKIRQEIIKDFFWDLTLYWAFDSMPRTEDAAEHDYGIVTSLGWTF